MLREIQISDILILLFCIAVVAWCARDVQKDRAYRDSRVGKANDHEMRLRDRVIASEFVFMLIFSTYAIIKAWEILP